MDEDPAYVAARRKVKSIKGFYLHVSIFALVVTFLFLVNLMSGGPWWVQWVILGWGIGIAAHAMAVFGLAGWLGSDWEEKKIKELMDRKPRS
jgi:two-component system LytT family sensor kinase